MPRQPPRNRTSAHGTGRHGSLLSLLQIPDRTVMAIMGWSNTAMAARYQRIIAAIRRDVANNVGVLRWKPAGPDDDGAAGGPAPPA